MNRLLFFVSFFFIFTAIGFSQEENPKFVYGSYILSANYDTASYTSTMIITKSGKEIYRQTDMDRVERIFAEAIGGSEKQIFISTYSGGAHCCFSLYAARIKSDKFSYIDTLFLGDSYFEFKDFNKDGVKEIETSNTMFAYAFTNFSQSRFPVAIYNFTDGKFKLVNDEFEKEVLKDVTEKLAELSGYTSKGFDCPATEDEDTFNTDAGAVKAILAAIYADYHSIGQKEKGMDLINKTYKCSDKKKFINILKTDYKLK